MMGKRHLEWAFAKDEAICLGVYYQPEYDALISHGGVAISRLSQDEQLLLSAEGADIFSEGIRFLNACVQVMDFAHRIYPFDYATRR